MDLGTTLFSKIRIEADVRKVPRLRIVADEREKPSGVANALKNLGVLVEYRKLEVADYIISREVAVERKEAEDFLRSLFDGRLFDQAGRLSQSYRIPIIIMEGDAISIVQQLKNRRSLWGAQVTLSLKYGIRFFQTSDSIETAELLHSLARHEGKRGPSRPLVSIRKPKGSAEISKAQLAVVACLPGIGPKLADGCLRRLKTVKSVFSATAAQLAMVPGLGRKRAERIVTFLNHPYEPPNSNTSFPSLSLKPPSPSDPSDMPAKS
ncbi:MAG: ERCC4 domain-containing protein [Candidatus Bathyarchaeia archaeon]